MKVRVISPSVTILWQNSSGVVKKLETADTAQVFLASSGSVSAIFKLEDLYMLKGSERPELKQLDGRKVTFLQKEFALKTAGHGVQFIKIGSQVEHPEMAAHWRCLLARGFQSGDELAGAVFVESASAEAWWHEWVQDPTSEATAEMMKALEDCVRPVLDSDRKALIVWPITNGHHWTCLAYLRADSQPLRAVYYDSLPSPGSLGCREKAQQCHGMLSHVLGSDRMPEFPETAFRTIQLDAHSCGLHVMNRTEELFRQFRGEGSVGVYSSIAETRKAVNGWIQVLLSHKSKQTAAPKPASGSSSSSSITGTSGSSAAAPAPLPPPEENPPAADEVAQPPLASTAGGEWGCSKCRWAVIGCMRCNPAKPGRYARGKCID